MPAPASVRITEARARSLLRHCKHLLIICAVAFAAFCICAFTKAPESVTWVLFAVYWVTGVGYFIWLGRLASGLGRSVIYYVGGTLLASHMIFLIAHAIAYSNITSAVAKTFDSGTAKGAGGAEVVG